MPRRREYLLGLGPHGRIVENGDEARDAERGRLSSWPMKMFSRTESSGKRLVSWKMIAMPLEYASLGLWSFRSSPFSFIRPESGW